MTTAGDLCATLAVHNAVAVAEDSDNCIDRLIVIATQLEKLNGIEHKNHLATSDCVRSALNMHITRLQQIAVEEALDMQQESAEIMMGPQECPGGHL